MIHLLSHYNLKTHTTFGVSAVAKSYTCTHTIDQLKEVLRYYQDEPVFILGGGSNMLLVNDLPLPVIDIKLKGITSQSLPNHQVKVSAMAGENWHDFVMYCIDQNWAGVENLALIPGQVGTSPVQNIGAYGVELKAVFDSCDVIDIKTGETKSFTKEDCKFGYRESIFKSTEKGRYIIYQVHFILTDLNRTNDYSYQVQYGAIQTQLEADGVKTLSLDAVAQAVIAIRKAKLPDPKVIGNCGSFFKNPIIPLEQYKRLANVHPEIPHYPVNEEQVKVPAGWLIDQCGLKGYRDGDAGIHDKQALVIVNHGQATGEELLALSRKVQATVKKHFGIDLQAEVNIL